MRQVSLALQDLAEHYFGLPSQQEVMHKEAFQRQINDTC